MIEKVRKYIQSNQILSQQELVLVGVSGGADSVALLIVLQQLGYTIVISTSEAKNPIATRGSYLNFAAKGTSLC